MPPAATSYCPPAGTSVKRIIGLPGELWEQRVGVVYINGRKLTEPYAPSDRRDFRRTPSRKSPRPLLRAGRQPHAVVRQPCLGHRAGRQPRGKSAPAVLAGQPHRFSVIPGHPRVRYPHVSLCENAVQESRRCVRRSACEAGCRQRRRIFARVREQDAEIKRMYPPPKRRVLCGPPVRVMLFVSAVVAVIFGAAHSAAGVQPSERLSVWIPNDDELRAISFCEEDDDDADCGYQSARGCGWRWARSFRSLVMSRNPCSIAVA